MNFKKLTLAAAISIGVLSAGNAMQAQADDLTPAPVSTVSTTNVDNTQVSAVDQSSSNNSADEVKVSTCNPCEPVAPVECNPCQPVAPCPCPTGGASEVIITPVVPQVVTGAACPVSPTTTTSNVSEQQACPTSMFNIPLSLCPTGNQVCGPVCSTCTGSSRNTTYIERQAYTYPTIYGENAAIGGCNQGVMIGEGPTGTTTTYTASSLYNLSAFPNVLNSTAIAPLGVTGAATSLLPYNFTGAAASTLMPYNFTGGAAMLPYNFTGGAAVIPSCGCPTSAQYSFGTPINPAQRALDTITMQTPRGIELQRTSLIPAPITITGAAAPASLVNQFVDIMPNFWAAVPINKLASAGIIAGYPDRSFKPDLPVSRAEFSSMLVSGLNLQSTPTVSGQIFRDVPQSHWASEVIDKVYNRGLITGYPNNTFHPNESITRAETLTILAKALPTCAMTTSQAQQILSQYSDASQVPAWAIVPVARALKSGLLQGMPNPNMISPYQSSSRADVASMLSQLRQELALEAPECPTASTPQVTGGGAMLQQDVSTVPTLSVKFNDQITASASHVGDTFSANTTEQIALNNIIYPSGSTVRGRIIEIIRPGAGCNNSGGIKLSFDTISYGGNTSPLPNQVLTAQVQAGRTSLWQGILSRIVEFPFVLPSRIVGTAARTVGGVVISAGNSTEHVFNNLGIASAELVQGELGAAGRTFLSSAGALIMAPVNVARTTLSGASGILNITTDELGYLVGADGSRITDINPNETVNIAFGCRQ